MTYQIIYSSESSTPMQADDLEDLLEQARAGNAEKDITGALLYVDGVFLQILEGDRPALQALMETIAADVRHEAVTVLKESEVANRRFGDWKMAYVSATPQQVASWAGVSDATAVPDVVVGMRQDPEGALQLAESIRSVLAS